MLIFAGRGRCDPVLPVSDDPSGGRGVGFAGTQPMRMKERLAIMGVLFGSPICAEYLQAYLPFTGDAALLLFGLFFFAPLYGGAALLIREAAVRGGRGWVGILLMSGAFGVLMPGVIDLAMLGEHRSDIPYWDELRLPTLIPALGLSAYPMSIWVLGHVVMSIGTPLALLDGLSPSSRGKPLLRWWGILLLVVAFLSFAWFVHTDGRNIYGYAPGTAQVVSVTAVAAALVLIAFSPIGRPLTPHPRGWTPGWGLSFAGGFIGLSACDLAQPTWVGFAVVWVAVVLGSAGVLWFARSPDWGPVQVTGLACGAITARTLLGFLSPVPLGVEPIAKYAQNAVFLVLVLGICGLARNTVRGQVGQHPEHVGLPAGV